MFHAFLSYSHHHDYHFARQLQHALETFDKPLLGKRRIRVFRDDSNLDATPDLWGSVAAALDQSSHLILLACPDAAKSTWVLREITRFLETRDLARVSIAVTAGRVPWPEKETLGAADCAISGEVYRLFASKGIEPRVIDLHRFRTNSGDLEKQATDFPSALADLVAAILQRPKEEIHGAILTGQRRIRRLAITVACVVLVLVGVVSYLSWQVKAGEDRVNVLLKGIEQARLQLQKSQAEGVQPGELEQLAVRLDQLIRGFSNEFDLDRLSAPERGIVRNAIATSVDAVYRIHPPDILEIDVVHLLPRNPYRLSSGDVLSIDAKGALPQSPIRGAYTIKPSGIIDLSEDYGSVKVAQLTFEEARTAIDNHLRQILRRPEVTIELLEAKGMQRIAGQHLVAPDGWVTLGMYGSVKIEGLSIAEAKQAVERHLSTSLIEPKVSLDVAAFNSMVYYVTIRDAEMGDQVHRFPVMGKQTVTDALSQLGALPPIDTIRLNNPGSRKSLEVNWSAIQDGDFTTDYRLLAGDRMVVQVKSRR
jgi:polysaccharide export outer membrane protein